MGCALENFKYPLRKLTNVDPKRYISKGVLNHLNNPLIFRWIFVSFGGIDFSQATILVSMLFLWCKKKLG